VGENTLATAVVLAAWEQRWDRLIPIAADLREGVETLAAPRVTNLEKS